jgi:tight adherence protein B
MRPIGAMPMARWSFPAVEAVLVALAAMYAMRGTRAVEATRWVRMAGCPLNDAEGHDVEAEDRRSSFLRRPWLAWSTLLGAGVTAGWLVAGPMGAVIGVAAGLGGRAAHRGKRQRIQAEVLEGQLADMAESVSLGLRSGLSVVQALEFARIEAGSPIRAHLDRFVDHQRLGVSFDHALEQLGRDLDTDDARFLVLVTGIHARSGGDLAGALDEVGRTIRHRITVRRELRAASAQGRISGVIMGSLPIGFFVFLSITSHSKLAPVLRSGAGMAMVGMGLALEGLAYVWIRRLLRVEV